MLSLKFVCFVVLFVTTQANKYSSNQCTTDENGNEHCLKDEEDEDEPCFYEEPEERLFQWDPVEVRYSL